MNVLVWIWPACFVLWGLLVILNAVLDGKIADLEARREALREHRRHRELMEALARADPLKETRERQRRWEQIQEVLRRSQQAKQTSHRAHVTYELPDGWRVTIDYMDGVPVAARYIDAKGNIGGWEPWVPERDKDPRPSRPEPKVL